MPKLTTGKTGAFLADGLEQLLLRRNKLSNSLFHQSIFHMRNIHGRVEFLADRFVREIRNPRDKPFGAGRNGCVGLWRIGLDIGSR